ncbi:hypothetical protein AV926_06350 [Myroides marinus]|uniref:Uncharacterized protein n=1 Tax=Myroides marinus TaxID=703342 RepID=A0A164A1X9_9FLAO|nr:hypothetical protein [Myroides marinus]KZE82853.1 hypothetical protein AV926_06350 [Myroides marinus]
MQTNFPQIWDYYQRYGPSEYQHNLMANTYVERMKIVLKEYDNSYDDSIYEALAWSGLDGTEAYNKLSSEKKQQLENTIQKYRDDEKNKTTCNK